MTPLKILMFSVDYPPDLGGISGHVYRLSRALANQGALVTVVGGHVLPTAMPAPSNDAVQPMLREVRIRRAGPRGFRAAWFVGQAKRFLHSLQKEEWDVLHYHNIFPDGLVLRDFREAKIRIFTNHSDAFLRAHESGRKRRWYHWLTSGASGIIAPSEEIAEKSRDFFRGNGQRLSTSPMASIRVSSHWDRAQVPLLPGSAHDLGKISFSSPSVATTPSAAWTI